MQSTYFLLGFYTSCFHKYHLPTAFSNCYYQLLSQNHFWSLLFCTATNSFCLTLLYNILHSIWRRMQCTLQFGKDKTKTTCTFSILQIKKKIPSKRDFLFSVCSKHYTYMTVYISQTQINPTVKLKIPSITQS